MARWASDLLRTKGTDVFRAGQDLTPVTAVESDAATSRLRWASEDSLLVGRADGCLVRLAL